MTEQVQQVTNSFEAGMELQSSSSEALLEKAKELGLTMEINNKTSRDEVIDAIIVAIQKNDEVKQDEDLAGTVFSLRVNWAGDEEKTARGLRLIKAARKKITMNQRHGNTFTIYQRNIAGELYSREVPGVRCTMENIERVLELVALVPDHSQDAVFNEFKASPDSFEAPILCSVRRSNQNGGGNTYVMLYIQKKLQSQEAVF